MLLLLIVAVYSCGSRNTCGDREATNFYEKHIKVVEGHKAGKAIGGRVYLSLFFLEEVTGLNGSASYGDISYYESQAIIKNDISKWTDWLSENECKLNLDTLRAIEKRILSNNTWLGIE
jgi:hypothetical protein